MEIKHFDNSKKKDQSRFDYVAYDQQAQDNQTAAKAICQALEKFVDGLGDGAGRAKALAQTHLEQTYMWIGKAIRDDQIQRNGSAPLQEGRKDG